MEEKITIFKVKYQGEPKITVLNAGATEKDIRFYLNHDQFIKATYTGDEEITIEVDEKQTEKKERKRSFLEYVENHKKLVLLSIMATVLYMVVFLSVAIKIIWSDALIKSTIISILWFGFSLFLFFILVILFSYYKASSSSRKSKYSALCMMINFMEKYSRLPESFQEIKRISKFRKYDEGLNQTIDLVVNFVAHIVSIEMIMFITIVLVIATYQDMNITEADLVSMIVIAYSMLFFVNKKIAEKGKYDFIINPIQMGINCLIQCCIKTRNVKVEDIVLAFYASKEWLEMVYPEIYASYNGSELELKNDKSENI